MIIQEDILLLYDMSEKENSWCWIQSSS